MRKKAFKISSVRMKVSKYCSLCLKKSVNYNLRVAKHRPLKNLRELNSLMHLKRTTEEIYMPLRYRAIYDKNWLPRLDQLNFPRSSSEIRCNHIFFWPKYVAKIFQMEYEFLNPL